MKYRIAILGIYHESNTFLNRPTTLKEFQQCYLLRGNELIEEYHDAYHEIGGMIEVLKAAGAEIIPVFFAQATPGGTITAAAFEALYEEMFHRLDQVLPVDGCLVIPHGAAVSEAHPDMDGHWLTCLREKLGDSIPVMGTLDPHANVSMAMAAATDVLISYKTNPHIDQKARGKDAARLMMDTLEGRIRPRQILKQLPLAISIEQQETEKDPLRTFLKQAAAEIHDAGVLSWSLCFGFPYADVQEMGTSILVITDGDEVLARTLGEQIASRALQDKKRFLGERLSVSEALKRLEGKPRPAVMLDMGDNVGGGAPGNSTYLMRALEADGKHHFFMCLYDPAAVALAETFEEGASFELTLRDDLLENEVLKFPVTLLQLGDGKFTEPLPRHGGQQHYDMGRTAVVATSSGNILMLNALRIPPFSLQQLKCFGIDPKAFDIVVAKGVHAPIAAYGPVCPTIIRVDTPGYTRADMTSFPFRHRRHPLYPFENF